MTMIYLTQSINLNAVNPIWSILAILVHLVILAMVIVSYIRCKNYVIKQKNLPMEKGLYGLGKNLK